jgi:UDP-N-acetylmuramoyl-tripeptide--D-alanyl-D-alanine ligase
VIRRTIGQLAAMCGAALNAAADKERDRLVTGVSRDSRQLPEGCLYVPLIGERFDGHAYAEDCLASGAAASIWQTDRPVPDAIADRPLLMVEDSLAALQQLARSYRRELRARIVGITGSNGKTTTKDLTASTLAAAYRVHKTAGNLNNHIGLPLTILDMEETADFAVLEMGMSGFGEIELLTGIAEPDIAIITNVGDAHMQQLGSRAGIAKAKLEIASGLKPGGLLLINGDEPLLTEGVRSLPNIGELKVQTFGLGEANDWSAGSVVIGAQESAFTVRPSGAASKLSGAFKIPVPGKHNVSNALAVVALASHCGMTAEQMKSGLSAVKLTSMRIETVSAYNGATILNDAFNANPTAVRAAIDLVGELTGFGRKWIVLGDMLELGADESRMHRETGALIGPDQADTVLTFGERSRHTAEGAAERLGPDKVIHFDEKAALAAYLKEHVKPNDLVLVKGSRGMRMEEIVQALQGS